MKKTKKKTKKKKTFNISHVLKRLLIGLYSLCPKATFQILFASLQLVLSAVPENVSLYLTIDHVIFLFSSGSLSSFRLR